MYSRVGVSKSSGKKKIIKDFVENQEKKNLFFKDSKNAMDITGNF